MIEQLIAAWEEWDRVPTSARTTNRLEDLCGELADYHGITATTLRLLILSFRTNDNTVADAITTAHERLEKLRVST